MATTECEHPEIDEGICMKCSQVVDLSSIDITMYKKFPGGVLVSKEEAKRKKQEKKLLDLDNTVIHVDENNFGISDEKVHNFLIKDKPYYVILRPGVIEFIKNISEFFEIRIVTQASRVYAAKILRLIDPEKKIQNEIYSREKSTLKDVPPSTPQSFTIIADDKVSVWEKKLQKSVALIYPFIPWTFIKNRMPLKDALRDKLLPRFEQFLKQIHKSFYESNCSIPIWKTEPFVEFKTLFNGIVALTETPKNGNDITFSCFCELGGKVVFDENDPSITHVITKYKPNFDENGDFVSLSSNNQREKKPQRASVAVKKEKHLVCVKPFWIIESIYHFKRLEPKDFLWITPKRTENANNLSEKGNESKKQEAECTEVLQNGINELEKNDKSTISKEITQTKPTEKVSEDIQQQENEHQSENPLHEDSAMHRKRCDCEDDKNELCRQQKKVKLESEEAYDFYSTSEEESEPKRSYIADDISDDDEDE